MPDLRPNLKPKPLACLKEDEDTVAKHTTHTTAVPAVPAGLDDPLVNRGVAFTEKEREALGLTGRLPSSVLTLEQQARRVYEQLQRQPTDLAKNAYLEQLHDRNEVLYYKVLVDHLAELLPVVYDPTVGDAIERYSHEYRRPRGIYLSIDRPDDIEKAFATLQLGPGDVDQIVCTDAEEILGLGDWGRPPGRSGSWTCRACLPRTWATACWTTSVPMLARPPRQPAGPGRRSRSTPPRSSAGRRWPRCAGRGPPRASSPWRP
jgi:hypothetical protein